ncbi:MAG: FAD-binding oxidoreductase [Gammaproteobacteria bacterium]|nr:FAD-binding oxidoreductase [Gammaproteobacteria bacterium]
MAEIVPPGISSSDFDRAMRECADIVGQEWVLTSQEDRDGYLDPMAPGDAASHAVAAAIAPASVEEIQGVLAVARNYGFPLWPISAGKNHGYGGPAPCMQGTVVLDLKRMNRIVEVNEELGYAIVEPGVTFFQLFDYLEANNIKLWLSPPAPGWGSVMGNALERGFGYTPYGDHSSMQCGMEVVLPDGEILRTGMGGVEGNRTWALFKHGYGPSWDQVFIQSNYGIVTKIGIWLMPEPEATASVRITVPNEEDLPQLVEIIRPLRIGHTINSSVVIANAVRRLAATSTRNEWYTGEGAMPEDLLRDIMQRNKWNFWEVSFAIFDSDEVITARLKEIERAFSVIEGATFDVTRWRRGEAMEKSARRVPNLMAYQVLNWRGGRGAHLGFAPVVAPTGDDATRIYNLMKRRIRDFGFDYFGGFTFFQRHAIHTSLILFDQSDQQMADNAHRLFDTVVREAAEMGYSEYRSHVSFMDLVADGYNYNGHALRRMNERMKDMIDPQGIIAPGKQGIWPAHLRGRRA